MDSDSDWTATGLFSPSKAKAHQAQAKDWAFVDSWLTKRTTSKRLPTFERNEDTLQALLSLATLNDAADEQRTSVDRVEKAALAALQKRSEPSAEGLNEVLLKNTASTSGLDTVADMSVLLNTSQPSALEIGTAIADLHDACFDEDQQVQRTEYQLQALKDEQERVKTLLTSLEATSLQPDADLPEQTAEWTRSSKHLRAKIGEYDERFASARSDPKPAMSFHDLQKSVADLSDQESQLQRLEAELAAFQSLPSDAKGARAKLEAARDDLRHLTKRRDTLFEKMGGA